ncbi:MAG: hypothetical protein AB8B63_10540 [Granulosicoccus sp.]
MSLHAGSGKSSTKKSIHRALSSLAESDQTHLEVAVATLAHADCLWRVSHPVNHLGCNTLALEHVWRPLKSALPDLERRDLIVVGGHYDGRDYVACLGHYLGTFRHDWLCIPCTGQPLYLRYGEVYEVCNGKVVQANLLWDILDVIRQAGFWPLAPSTGTEGRWAGPITGDGIQLGENDPAQSAASLQQTLDMHRSLFEFDDAKLSREALLHMNQKDFWHPKMMWYGPSGIGTTRGLAGFVDYHQLPFRLAFARPQGTMEEVQAARAAHGAGHYIRIGDGAYSVTGGWPSVYAQHVGGSFAGTAGTNKAVTMRVMDFYLHHEGLIRENWVPLDMLDLLQQMGLDVMARMQEQLRR